VVGVVDAGSGRRAVAYWSCGGVEKERLLFGKKSCVRREVGILIRVLVDFRKRWGRTFCSLHLHLCFLHPSITTYTPVFTSSTSICHVMFLSFFSSCTPTSYTCTPSLYFSWACSYMLSAPLSLLTPTLTCVHTSLTSCTSHVIHAPSFLNNFILLFIYLLFILFIFIIKKQIYLKIIKKLQKNRKSKYKNVLFHFIVSVWSLAPCDTYFLKNTKNDFLSLLVFVRPLASCDTCFQLIQKYQKNIKFQNIKTSTFFNKYLLKNYVILDSLL